MSDSKREQDNYVGEVCSDCEKELFIIAHTSNFEIHNQILFVWHIGW